MMKKSELRNLIKNEIKTITVNESDDSKKLKTVIIVANEQLKEYGFSNVKVTEKHFQNKEIEIDKGIINPSTLGKFGKIFKSISYDIKIYGTTELIPEFRINIQYSYTHAPSGGSNGRNIIIQFGDGGLNIW